MVQLNPSLPAEPELRGSVQPGGVNKALNPGQSPTVPLVGKHRCQGCPAEPFLPRWAGSSHRSRPAWEEGKSLRDFSGCDDKHGGASKHISMQEFCITCLCICNSGPEAAKIKLKLIFFLTPVLN